MKALGALGVELLLTGPHAEPVEKTVPVELIIRGSSVVSGWSMPKSLVKGSHG